MNDIAADALIIIGSVEAAEILDDEELKRTLMGSAATYRKPEAECPMDGAVDK